MALVPGHSVKSRLLTVEETLFHYTYTYLDRNKTGKLKTTINLKKF